jgi:hypothetical protein
VTSLRFAKKLYTINNINASIDLSCDGPPSREIFAFSEIKKIFLEPLIGTCPG